MSEESEKPDPFVIIKLKDLKIRKFSTEDEWRIAIVNMKKLQLSFIPLRYHNGAEMYVQPEVVY